MKKRLEALGHWFFFVMMRFFGHGGAVFLLRPVIFCYVLFSGKIHRITGHYLKHRFPGVSKWKYWLYTYKSMFSFGHVLVDRGWLGANQDARFEGELLGYDTIVDLINKKKGVVLLTAHVGNWQSSFAHLEGLPVKVHALMRYEQEAASKHYFDIKKGVKPFEIIDAEGPFGGMIDASAALSRGEVVTIMGDRLIKGSSSEVEFLGEKVRLPDAAYMLAATANAPVVVLLTAKTGEKKYQVKVWGHFYPEYKNRDERAEMLQKCARQYIQLLEKYLKKYPFQWYNFYNFWKQ